MQTHTQSLLDYLRTPNPAVSGEACPSGRNSMSSKASYEIPRKLRKWEDFEYDTLRTIYGGQLRKVLEQEFSLQDFSEIPDFPFCKYFDENSLESLLIKWNHSTVSEALAKAQAVLGQTQDHIYMVRGGQAESPYPERKWKPDWGSVRMPKSGTLEKRKNLLPGDTKVSTKWSSAMIKTEEPQFSREDIDWMRPLRQIYSYCLRNETRYGYIITDAELVVLRVRLDHDFNQQMSFDSMESFPESQGSLVQRARDAGILEYKAIPWVSGTQGASHTAQSMTVNLALWWLHLIARGNTNIAEDYGALRDATWGTTAEDQVPSLGHLALSQVSIDISRTSGTST